MDVYWIMDVYMYVYWMFIMVYYGYYGLIQLIMVYWMFMDIYIHMFFEKLDVYGKTGCLLMFNYDVYELCFHYGLLDVYGCLLMDV